MAGNKVGRNSERYSLFVDELWLGSIETEFSPNQIVMLWEFWRDEARPDCDEQFTDWLLREFQIKKADSGNKIHLGL